MVLSKISNQLKSSDTLYFALLVFCFCLLYLVLHNIYGIFHLPFFWDELGVYSQSALFMAEHNLSILPASVPDNISRGHPLLATFLYSLFFKIFGTHLWVAKFTSILFYFVGIVFSYKTIRLFTTDFWAFLFTLIILVQPIFVSQSLMILPELLLASITIASIYYYLKEKYSLCILFLCLAVLTKESGLVLPIAFGISHVLVTRKWKQSLALLLIPVAVFGIFLVIQKMQNGYYLYPLHESLIDFHWKYILVKKSELYEFIFHSQGRSFFTYGILITLFIYFFRDKIVPYNIKEKKLFVLVAFLFVGGFLFTIINFYLARYSQFFLLPLLLLAVIFISKLPRLTKLSFSILLIIIGIQNLDNKEKFVDSDMAYVAHIKAQQRAFDYIMVSIPLDKNIGYNWPMSMNFWNKNIGFDLPYNIYHEIYKDKPITTDYIALSNPGELIEEDHFIKDYLFLKEFKVDYAIVRLYEKK